MGRLKMDNGRTLVGGLAGNPSRGIRPTPHPRRTVRQSRIGGAGCFRSLPTIFGIGQGKTSAVMIAQDRVAALESRHRVLLTRRGKSRHRGRLPQTASGPPRILMPVGQVGHFAPKAALIWRRWAMF